MRANAGLCSNCGVELYEGANYCIRCGKPVSREAHRPVDTDDSNRAWARRGSAAVWGGFASCFVICLLILVGVFALFVALVALGIL